MTKFLIFDASSLISLSMTGLTSYLRDLKKVSDVKFIITKEVKKEAIDTPLTIPRFELEGIRLNELLEEKILEMPSILGISDDAITKKTQEILDLANTLFVGTQGKEIHLIDLGESSCLALNKILEEKKIKSFIAIDERTTRSLTETPKDLKRFLEEKLHTKINVNQKSVDFFKNFKFIRSTELIYASWKKGILKFKDKNRLQALFYALKYKGCSISQEDIQTMVASV